MKKKRLKAKLVTEVTVIDPDSHLQVAVAIYKEIESGSMFGIDSSYVEQVLGEDESVPSIINPGYKVDLLD
jgi:exosome complex RNA-binding protein Rrp4